VDRLDQYQQFTDEHIYKVLIDLYPALVDCFDKLAEMQAVSGFTDEELLRSFRETLPESDMEVWKEGNEFRGRLMLRGIHHLANGLRERKTNASLN
jgi:hypothetical protein